MAPSSSSSPHVLTEFRAGVMRKDGTKLAADPRRGLVRVVRVSGKRGLGAERAVPKSAHARGAPADLPSHSSLSSSHPSPFLF